ncbi:MAG: amidohydrolase [Acidobacteria bacterium]|nr:amidohydrolase [Acidobacteriota bacterium]
MRRLRAATGLLILPMLMAACAGTPTPPVPDLVVLHARIWTGDGTTPEAEALAVREGRIIAVGRSSGIAAMAGEATRRLDAGGRRVVPGFNDAHWHLPTSRTAELIDSGSEQEIVSRLQAFAATLGPDDWVTGRGWGPSDFPGQVPHRRALDAAFPDRPVVLTDRDGHMVLANQVALQRGGVTRETPDPPNGRIGHDASGELTGLLQEAASRLVRSQMPPVSADQVYQSLREQMRKAASYGITSLQVASGSAASGVEFEAYERALREQTVDVRLRLAVPFRKDATEADLASYVALRESHAGQLVRFGIAKGLIDGTVDGYTAAMLEPYADRDDRGLPMFTDDELQAAVAAYDRAGLQVQLHAIGDRAIRMALDAYAHAAQVNGTSGRRHRVEHVEVPALDDLPRFKALGVIASTQALFASPDAITLTSYVPKLGPARASRSNAFRLFDDAGAVQAFGSDHPVFPMEVMRGIHAAVTRQLPDGTPAVGFYPEHRISVEAAVRHFTADAAYASFEEAEKGVLSVGRVADLVVLSDDIFTMPVARLHAVTAHTTVMHGRVTWQAPQ